MHKYTITQLLRRLEDRQPADIEARVAATIPKPYPEPLSTPSREREQPRTSSKLLRLLQLGGSGSFPIPLFFNWTRLVGANRLPASYLPRSREPTHDLPRSAGGGKPRQRPEKQNRNRKSEIAAENCRE